MKNLKMKLIALGVLSTVVISSTPIFAKNNTMAKNDNKSVSTTNRLSGTITIDGFGGLSLYRFTYKAWPIF